TFTIGYVGSIGGYEGLDDLVRGFGQLVGKGIKARLVRVGDGNVLSDLKSLTASLRLDAEVVFAGRVPPKMVPKYMSIMDVIALPRKPVRVCELVSPLKPLEAMATKVPMVVSDVPALA